MTDLKMCPDCPTYAVCEHCGASHDTRPAPELPEGYRVHDNQLLRRVDTGGVWPERRVADIDEGGRLWCRFPLEPEETPALAAFLQGAR